MLFGVGKFDQDLASLACEPEMDSPFRLTRNLKYLCFQGIWPNLAFNLTGPSSTNREKCEILIFVLPSLKLIPLKIIDDLFIA